MIANIPIFEVPQVTKNVYIYIKCGTSCEVPNEDRTERT